MKHSGHKSWISWIMQSSLKINDCFSSRYTLENTLYYLTSCLRVSSCKVKLKINWSSTLFPPAFGFKSLPFPYWDFFFFIMGSEIVTVIGFWCFHYIVETKTACLGMKTIATCWKWKVFFLVVCLLGLWVRGFNLSCTPAKMINGIPMHSDWFSQVI